MLEVFHVPEADAVRVPAEALHRTVRGLLEKVGVPPEEAHLAADVLIAADLMGVDSHGVSNMLRIYLERYREGRLNPRPRPRVVRETPATATMDGDRGLGIIVGHRAMDLAIRKARDVGMGMVTLRNSGHLGMIGYFALRAVPHGMIGLAMTATGPTMVPTFGREPRLGTNPIAVAVPAGEEPPFLFDGAMTPVAVNKVWLTQRYRRPLPPGILADEEGRPVLEPRIAPSHFRLLPLGSLRETGSHKGYSLACMVEVLAGLLSAAGFGAKVGSGHYAHAFLALRVDAFRPLEEFRCEMDEFLRALKATPPAPGHERVLVAGQPEWEEQERRKVRGIPLHREVVQWFRETCAEMGVPLEWA